MRKDVRGLEEVCWGLLEALCPPGLSTPVLILLLLLFFLLPAGSVPPHPPAQHLLGPWPNLQGLIGDWDVSTPFAGVPAPQDFCSSTAKNPFCCLAQDVHPH